MNSYERKALNRANDSKLKWKTKAIDRNTQLRAVKARIRDLVKSRQMWRERYLAHKMPLKGEPHEFLRTKSLKPCQRQ